MSAEAIHVAHLVTSFDVGGLQNGLVNLINGSDPRRVRHTVVSMLDRTGMKERLLQGDVHTAGLEPGRRSLAAGRIAPVLRSIGPDVLHTRNWGTWLDGALAGWRARVPIRVHGHHGRDVANAHGESWKRRLIGRFLARGTDRIITLTPSMRAEYERDFNVRPDEVTVIPNGVDLERLAQFDEDADLGSTFTVATVGRLDAVKNIPMLVRGFAAMVTRQMTDRLVIVGDGPERARIEDTAREAGVTAAVVMTGARHDVPAVLKAADVYVQPSIYEGMSNTIVEAMASGVSVIATDVGGNGDVLGRDGTGVLVPNDDAAAMAMALDGLRADPDRREALARRGRERAIERFGLARMIEEYTGVYESLVDRRVAATGRVGAR